MQGPAEVAAMLRLKALGWGVRRIAAELGCSLMTVSGYVAEEGDALDHTGPDFGSPCSAWLAAPSLHDD
jgi:hypothetical protein